MAIEEVREFYAFENLALMKFAGIQYRNSRQRSGCYSQQYAPYPVFLKLPIACLTRSAVDKAVNYILSQPDGTLAVSCQGFTRADVLTAH